jgi:hypothetical protein
MIRHLKRSLPQGRSHCRQASIMIMARKPVFATRAQSSRASVDNKNGTQGGHCHESANSWASVNNDNDMQGGLCHEGADIASRASVNNDNNPHSYGQTNAALTSTTGWGVGRQQQPNSNGNSERGVNSDANHQCLFKGCLFCDRRHRAEDTRQEYQPKNVCGRKVLRAIGQAYVQGNGGQPGTCKWQLLDGKKGRATMKTQWR